MTVSLLIKLDFYLSFYYRSWVTRCLTRSGLDSGSRGLGSIAGRVIVMCFQARHFTCSVSFPTQGYTWVPTNWQGSLLRCREEGEGGTLPTFAFFSVFYPEWRKSDREGESVDGCSERWYASTLWTSKYWTDSPFLFIVRDISSSVVCIVCIEMSYSGICLSVGFSFCLLFYLPVCRSSCVCRTDFLSVGLCTCLSFLAISRWSSDLSP